MYKLYWAPGTGAFAPQALFEEMGVPFEKIEVDLDPDGDRGADFLAVSPLGQVPVLTLPDGTAMTESAAIVLHLVDAHPEAGLAPAPGSPGRAHFLRWLLFMATELYPAYLRLYYADRYTADRQGAGPVAAAARDAVDRDFGILDEALEPGPHLLGGAFSAADVYLAMLAGWHPEPAKLAAARPRVARLVAQVKARPAIARIWAEQNFGGV